MRVSGTATPSDGWDPPPMTASLAARGPVPAVRGPALRALRALARRRAVALQRPQRGEGVAPGQIQPAAVGDDRVVRALPAVELDPAGRRAEADRPAVAEVGEVDDVADHRRGARDPPA